METIYIWRNTAEYTRRFIFDDDRPDNVQTPLVESGAIAFRKPKRPTITTPARDGYRLPTAYAAGATGTLGIGTVSGTRWFRGYRQEHGGTILMTCPSAKPSLFLAEAGSNNNRNKLRTQILNNIGDEVLDVSMVLAEMQGTVNTATTMLNRIGRSMLAIKRRNPESYSYLLTGRRRDGRRPTDKFLRTTAGEYLQWKYGIMPSVYDLEGALRGLDINESGGLFNNPPLLTARSSVKNSYSKTLTAGSGWITGLETVFDVTTEVKARCDFSVKSEGLRGLNRYGVGLSSIPTILWDKTPFTFVLNMAIPISSIIKAWYALVAA